LQAAPECIQGRVRQDVLIQGQFGAENLLRIVQGAVALQIVIARRIEIEFKARHEPEP
jgi:hypothetical protein